ncbi:MAG: DUF4954 family protein [Spirochaetes bacterium]|nr:DUF4954 family protein [Spirochaetota bacterium]
MNKITILPGDAIGKNFLPAEFLSDGHDEFYLRNQQCDQKSWRNLTADEKDALIRNGNLCSDWNLMLVTGEFDPDQIHNSRFYGLVRIGRMLNRVLQHNDLFVPSGISNSTLISCDLGDDVAVHNVSYLAYYIIGSECILSNIDEMHSTNHAKFGNGIIKDGESENVRIWIDLMNETGCRKILPFDGMLTADAYLWAKYRDDLKLQSRLKEITQARYDSRRGYYGRVGKQTVIKNSRILKDVLIGEHAYIKGANKLKNLTINSSAEESTQIGEGVELVNGIIGFGCHVFYGCKAVRFILGNNANLKYGARLINSYLGDNSTVSCCEILNNLIFPAHEQHHNNSFLIASVVMGQSNLAAGATIGSNHNSRANDNEVQAGRGFWPGLCTSIKHSSCFASFVLLAKGDYPAELNIPLPFSLVNNNETDNCLEIMPAYWWMYNMYALARNTGKYQQRDKRIHRKQHIEFDFLAPDSIEEAFNAMRLLEIWTAASFNEQHVMTDSGKTEHELMQQGRELLGADGSYPAGLTVYAGGLEKSKRKIKILKAKEAYSAYREMIKYYAVRNVADFLSEHPEENIMSLNPPAVRNKVWINLGGQLVPEESADALRNDINSGMLGSWDDIHGRYDRLWEKYPYEKMIHAYASLKEICGTELTQDVWHNLLKESIIIQNRIYERVFESRRKDFDNPFRKSTFRNEAEMKAAVGTVEENEFLIQAKKETENYAVKIKGMLKGC